LPAANPTPAAPEPNGGEPAAAAAARRIALQMLEERGRGAVLVGVARVDAALERLLQAALLPAPGTLRRLRNTFAHSSDSASLTDPSHADRLAQAYNAARTNPLWHPLEAVLSQAAAPGSPPLDPALRNYILLVTILVAFLEAAAQQLRPIAPAVVMGFTGLMVG
jgi:hypothetical protein